MKKAIIAMSGGVDSSVAALLTKESGDECIGATMKLFHNEDVGIKEKRHAVLWMMWRMHEVYVTEWESNIMSLISLKDSKKT